MTFMVSEFISHQWSGVRNLRTRRMQLTWVGGCSQCFLIAAVDLPKPSQYDWRAALDGRIVRLVAGQHDGSASADEPSVATVGDVINYPVA